VEDENEGICVYGKVTTRFENQEVASTERNFFFKESVFSI
jgi:hypothetical protein